MLLPWSWGSFKESPTYLLIHLHTVGGTHVPSCLWWSEDNFSEPCFEVGCFLFLLLCNWTSSWLSYLHLSRSVGITPGSVWFEKKVLLSAEPPPWPLQSLWPWKMNLYLTFYLFFGHMLIHECNVFGSYLSILPLPVPPKSFHFITKQPSHPRFIHFTVLWVKKGGVRKTLLWEPPSQVH